MTIRTRILPGILVLALGGGAYHLFDIHLLERGLHPIAEAQSAAIKTGLDGGNVDAVATDVAVSRDYLLVGRASAKVSVYTARQSPGGQAQFESYDYFYVRDGNEWVLAESGRCTDEACEVRARDLFRK